MTKWDPNKRAGNFRDETGKTYGQLTVLSYAGRDHNNSALWLCQCDCGQEQMTTTGTSLRTGNTSRCLKCADRWRRERVSEVCTTHGMSRAREYNTWRGIIDRCFNPSHKYYARYGGRGITMCDRWRNSFEAFLADMGPRPPGTELDRIDNDGPYTGPCPEYPNGNCRWVTRRVNSNNTKRTVLITHEGETLTMKEWAARTGIPYGTLHARHMRGRPLFTPVNKK